MLTTDQIAEQFEGIPYGDDDDPSFTARLILSWLPDAEQDATDCVYLPAVSIRAIGERLHTLSEIVRQNALVAEPETDPETGALIQ